MDRNPRLDEAVAVFAELGWADATYADAPTLPLGTPAQRRAALAGLRAGDWDRYGHLWGRPPVADVDLSMLWLFAVRVGVSARRAVALYDLKLVPDLHDAAFAVLVERGPEFARTFVKNTNHDLSFSSLPVRLVDHYQLPVPQEPDYIGSWALQVKAFADEGQRQHVVPVSEATLQGRYTEHVRIAFAAGLSGVGMFDQALVIGVERGWADRDEVIGLAVAALDAASGTDRWGSLIRLDYLHVTDEELVAHTDALVPVLAGGAGPATDAFVVERLAPALIAGASDDMVADVATAALTAPTKKALRVVLKALEARPHPSAETVNVLGPQVTALDTGRDRALARSVQTIVDSWGITSAPRGD
ncbi:MAG: hypothetical protein FWH11_12050 [Micrococcales bacterium]|nr:hypothetical protein [Micrococcales bacterium]